MQVYPFASSTHVGKSFQDKLKDLRKELAEKKTSGMVVSMLDEVAWLFNLRGSDIDYNPVFFAYALITHDSATLYIDESKLSKEIKDYLKDVKISPYEEIFGHIKTLGEGIDASKTNGKIFVSNKCSWALTLSLGENKVTEGVFFSLAEHAYNRKESCAGCKGSQERG